MVYDLECLNVLAQVVFLAHGADPTPLAWDEALANLVKFAVTFLLIAFLSYPVLGPLLSEETETQEEGEPKSQIMGWVGAGLLVVLGLGWWLTRSSLVEVMTEEPRVKEDHAHTQVEGGQLAMWADFHAEVVRVESGEVRIYLRDSYNRDIAARFYDAQVQVLELDGTESQSDSPQDRPPAPTEDESPFLPTQSALNEVYRFARLPVEKKAYRVRVNTPGWSTTLRFRFDGEKGRRSLPIWCATPD